MNYSLALMKRFAAIIANLIPQHIQEREANAYRRGYEEGSEVSRRPMSTVGPQPIDRSIYGPGSFQISESMRADMRRTVAEAVAKYIVEPPTEAQWGMIFSTRPATCVVAGAGSGKSTTLILRIVFMLEYLKVRQEDMTVVSFTTASCEELRNSLIHVMRHWGRSLSHKEAKQLIRTFHSALYRVARNVFGGITFFETLDNADSSIKVEDEVEIDNPLSSSKLNNQQMKLLKDVYRDLFHTDEIFRKHVIAMLAIECCRDSKENTEDKEYKSAAVELASKRDVVLVRTVNQRWKERGHWPDIELREGPIKVFDVNGHAFQANALTASGVPVFLGGFYGRDKLFDSEEEVGDLQGKNTFGILNVLKMKKNIIGRFCSSEYHYLDSPTAVQRLTWRIHHLERPDPVAPPPIFDIQLDGEIAPTSIFETFLAQANFIESMGLQVVEAVKKMRPFRSECLEYHFCHAIARFWPYFNSILQSKRIMTFNQAFLLLSSEDGEVKPIRRESLRPFRHLLIDEFQDISPQIARWLTRFQRLIAAQEEKSQIVSIMAIGDDWQSIYGWRGSAPDFFIKFDRHFPSHPSIDGAMQCLLTENFRSIEPIVRDAEMMLVPVLNKTTKRSTAMRVVEPGDHGIDLKDCGEYNDKCLDNIADFIRDQFKYAQSIPKSHKNKVLVMSRRNDLIDRLKKRVGKESGLLFYTYHRSKGLQAEIAIMVEDCAYDQSHKFRNRIYECSGLFDGYDYDQAMKDEAFRLAYVGATRGRRRVFWFVNAKKGAAKKLAESKPQAAARHLSLT